MTLAGKDRADHLRAVQADIERTLRGGRDRWSRLLSTTEMEALMVRAVESVTGKDAEHARREGEALAEEYTQGAWSQARWETKP